MSKNKPNPMRVITKMEPPCKLNVDINDGTRKNFGWHRWESICHLRQNFGYRSMYDIFETQKKRFIDNLILTENSVLSSLYYVLRPAL